MAENKIRHEAFGVRPLAGALVILKQTKSASKRAHSRRIARFVSNLSHWPIFLSFLIVFSPFGAFAS